nr:DUF1289 domain-containing protein [Paracoccus saliphilus]
MIESPCIQICQIDPDANLCVGCFRSLTEIACWGSMTPQARRAVMHDLPAREAALSVAGQPVDMPRRGS